MKPKCTFISWSFYVILLFELFFLVLSIGGSRVYVLLSCYLIDQGNKSWFRGVLFNILSGSSEPACASAKCQVVNNLAVFRR
jgi:hypothetical protein